MRLSSLYTNVYTVGSLIVQVLLTETIKASKQFQGEAKYFVRPKPIALSRNSSVKTNAKNVVEYFQGFLEIWPFVQVNVFKNLRVLIRPFGKHFPVTVLFTVKEIAFK